MGPGIISALFAVGAATWVYVQLARANGNATPQSNFIATGVVGLVIFLFMLSLLKLVFNF